MFTHVIFNLQKSSGIRFETLEGRQHVVVPAVMLVEGVHDGSDGPLYYSSTELSKTPQAWNYKPIVVYHPLINNQGVSACDPQVINDRKVGVIMNTRWDGKLRTEAWIDPEKADQVDPRIMESINRGEIMEVSAAAFLDADSKDGEWRGERYNGVVSNLRPDHLALLPDQVGACSISDGAGLLMLNSNGKPSDPRQFTTAQLLVIHNRIPSNTAAGLTFNELSYSNITEGLYRLLREKFGDDVWIEDVYEDNFVYSDSRQLWQQGFAKSDTGISLVGEPSEVFRVIEYRESGGASVGSAAGTTLIPYQQREGIQIMNKKQLVDDLITNEATGWEEPDRDWLMSLEDNRLKKFVVNDESDKPGNPDTQTNPKPAKPAEESPLESPQKRTDLPPEAKPTENRGQTVDQFVANAPPEYRDMLQHGLHAFNREREQLIDTIVANSRNKFSREYLETRPIAELEGVAELAREAQATTVPMYHGAAGGVPTSNAHKEEPLVPSWD